MHWIQEKHQHMFPSLFKRKSDAAGKIPTRVKSELYAADISIANTGPLVFTFDNTGSAGPVDERLGWGFEYLKGRGFNVVSFLESDHRSWYRRPDFFQLVKDVNDLLAPLEFSSRVSYGGSMGGYAAAAYAQELKVDRAILLNPISTLNPDLAPWELRWKTRKKVSWTSDYFDGVAGIADVSRVDLVVDPLFGLDNRHAKRFSAFSDRCTVWKIPGVGHMMPFHMAKLGLLETFVLTLISGGEPDAKGFYAQARKRREYDRYYAWMLSDENKRLTPKTARVISEAYVRMVRSRNETLDKALNILS